MNFTFSRVIKQFANHVAFPMLMALASLPTQAGSRYLPNSAGDEITDTRTGLIWRRCAEGQSWNGSSCMGSYQVFTLDGALAHAQSQANSGLAWRLPNVKELASLAERSRVSPAIDSTAFPGTPSTDFWSSTPYSGDASIAWRVKFGVGDIDRAYRYYNLATRLVRDSQ